MRVGGPQEFDPYVQQYHRFQREFPWDPEPQPEFPWDPASYPQHYTWTISSIATISSISPSISTPCRVGGGEVVYGRVG